MALSYTRVSTSASGAQANGNSYGASVSPDGTSVVFYSLANNLVAGDTNVVFDVFLKNLTTGAVMRLSSSAAGVQGDAASADPVFSPDGTRVLFASQASNLVAGDTNGKFDIFVKTIATGAITRVSTNAAGVQANGDSSTAVFSPDGTKVAFLSNATNLVAGDTNGVIDLFVKDLVTGAVTRIPFNAFGGFSGLPGSAAGSFAFSPDGARIAVSANSSLYLVDLATGAATRLSTRGDGSLSDDAVFPGSSQPAFSPDGTQVAFGSNATFLVAGDTNGVTDVFVKELNTGAVSRVSTSATGAEANSFSLNLRFSPDGTQIAFLTLADNLVPGVSAFAIVVKDVGTGLVTLVADRAETTLPVGDERPQQTPEKPVFTPDGKSVVFSTPTALILGDTNGVRDIYLAALPEPPPGAITFTSSATATTPENVATSTVVYTAQATDTVPGQTLTYVLSGGPDAGRFTIDAATGAVSFRTSPDFETPIDGGHSNLYRVIVTATDGVRATGQPVTISVTDLNDNSPVFNSATVATVATGFTAGAAAYTARAIDADVADTVTYSLAGGADAAKFTIDAATGAVAFKVSPSFAAPDDAGADHVYDLTVRASDGVAAHDAFRAVKISVADPAARPPVGTPTPVASVSLVSTNAAGVQGNAYNGLIGSSDAAFSADGTKIAFVSWSDNLVPGDANGFGDVFVKTLATGAIVLASTRSNGAPLFLLESSPVFSPDGARVLFGAFGLLIDSVSQQGLLIKNLGTGALTPVTAYGAPVSGQAQFLIGREASFLPDGSSLIFTANGGPGDTNLAADVYTKVLAGDVSGRISHNAAGEIGNAASDSPVGIVRPIAPGGKRGGVGRRARPAHASRRARSATSTHRRR